MGTGSSKHQLQSSLLASVGDQPGQPYPPVGERREREKEREREREASVDSRDKAVWDERKIRGEIKDPLGKKGEQDTSAPLSLPCTNNTIQKEIFTEDTRTDRRAFSN